MKVILSITDETIRSNVTDAVKECEEENWIAFPNDTARSEFIEECVQEVIDNYETSDYYDHMYEPDYEEIVLDNAKWYEYCVEV